MKNYIQIGIDKGLISLNEDRSRMKISTISIICVKRARTLQEDGKRLLEEAKQEPERILLSGE